MAIYSGAFVVYERLASAKMNSMVTAINSHTHNGVYGAKINFSDLAGTIAASQIPAGLITGTMIANGTITTSHILNGTITISDIDRTSIHLSADGYAVYAT